MGLSLGGAEGVVGYLWCGPQPLVAGLHSPGFQLLSGKPKASLATDFQTWSQSLLLALGVGRVCGWKSLEKSTSTASLRLTLS